ncbi:TIGR04255 family protein [Aliivibrio wodanis]|uniref:TIGR04255 family protein n=1 Tax=Aliivibrio wodanis TaxID=80852 RepID=UPI00406D4281
MIIKGYKEAPLIMSLIDIQLAELPNFDASKRDALFAVLSKLGFKVPVTEIQTQLEIQLPKQGIVEGAKFEPRHSAKETQRWVFLNLEKNTSIFVTAKNIAIKTTSYQGHESFVALFEKVLNGIVSVFPDIIDSAITRIGTRYLNLIVPKDERKIEDYLSDGWLTSRRIKKPDFNSKPGINNRVLMHFDTDFGILRVESNEFNPNGIIPINIIPNDLIDGPETGLDIPGSSWWSKSFSEHKPYVALDIDLGLTKTQGFDVISIMTTLNDMRTVTKPAFEMCITTEARNDWTPIY